MSEKKQYIGDGVYADFDGYPIVLTTERDGRIETIYLEDSVLSDLFSYISRVKKVRVEVTTERYSEG